MDIMLPNGTMIQGVPEGTTKEELREKLLSQGIDPDAGSFDPSQRDVSAGSQMDFGQEVAAGVDAFAQGLTLGFSDEIEAGLRSLTGDETYEEALEDTRARMEANKESDIWSTAEIVGSLPLAAIPGVGWAKGASTLSNVGKLAAEGAAYGGAYGAGTSEADLFSNDSDDFEQFISDVAGDAAIGAIGGPALVGGGRAIGKGIDRVAGNISDDVRKNLGDVSSEFVRKQDETRSSIMGDPSEVARFTDGYGNVNQAELNAYINSKFWNDKVPGKNYTYGQVNRLREQLGNVSKFSEAGGKTGLQRVIQTVDDELVSDLGLKPTIFEKVGIIADRLMPEKGKDLMEYIGVRDPDLFKKRKGAMDKGIRNMDKSLKAVVKGSEDAEMIMTPVLSGIREAFDIIRKGDLDAINALKSKGGLLSKLQGKGVPGEEGFQPGEIHQLGNVLPLEVSDGLFDIVNTLYGYAKVRKGMLEKGEPDVADDMLGKITALGAGAFTFGPGALLALPAAKLGIGKATTGANIRRLGKTQEAFEQGFDVSRPGYDIEDGVERMYGQQGPASGTMFHGSANPNFEYNPGKEVKELPSSLSSAPISSTVNITTEEEQTLTSAVSKLPDMSQEARRDVLSLIDIVSNPNLPESTKKAAMESLESLAKE